MRTFVVATVTVGVVALTGGCAASGDSHGSEEPQGTGITQDSPSPAPKTSATPTPGPGDVAVVDSKACEEVRIGIDAFNAGEFDGTVEHFRAALPLAEEQDDGSVLAGQLIEAVRYYAELDPELYPEASRSSPKFARYKAITLGQCVAGLDGTPQSPGTKI